MRTIFPALIFCAFSLSGCAVSNFLKSDQPATRIYALRAAEIQPHALPQKSFSHVIGIERPLLPPGFDTARIAMYLDGGRRLDYYAAAQWTAPLDEALQEFTSQTARKTLPNLIIAEPGQSAGVEYRLQMRVNDFEPVYSGTAENAPILKASLTFTLLKMPDEEIVTNFTIDQQQPLRDNSLGSIAGSLEAMLQSVEAKALETISPYLK